MGLNLVPSGQDGVTVTVTSGDPATVRWPSAAPAFVKVTASGGAVRFSLRGNAAPDSSGVVVVPDGQTATVSTRVEATPITVRVASDTSVSVTVAGFRDADTGVSAPYPVVTPPSSGGASKLSDLTDVDKTGAAVGKVVTVSTTAGGDVTGWGLANPVAGGSGAVASVAGKVGDVTLTKSDVGLNNVNNTADANKPISSAAQTALDGKAALSHTQAASTITDFVETVQDTVAAMLGAGSNVTVSYDDTAGTLTISAAGGAGGGLDAEAVRDAIGSALVGVGNIAVVVDDSADTISITTTATANATNEALRDRTTHTGQSPLESVSGLLTALAAKANSNTLAPVATTGDYADLTSRPNFAAVATTGSYADLADTPTIPATFTTEQAQDAAAALLTAGGHTGIAFVYDDTNDRLAATVTVTGGSGGLDETQVNALIAAQMATLAPVATTGTYESLTTKPDVAALQTQVATLQSQVLELQTAVSGLLQNGKLDPNLIPTLASVTVTDAPSADLPAVIDVIDGRLVVTQ